MDNIEFYNTHKGRRVKIINGKYKGIIGVVVDCSMYNSVWVEWEDENQWVFHIADLELIPVKVVPLPLPG